MFLLLLDTSNIRNLTSEQLQYIPKIVLLREFSKYINELWDRLPEYIKVDPEVRQYRRCLEHYNRPWQRTHIDGPAPLVKDCIECRHRHEKSVAGC
jgi:hypothetical protein